MKQDIFRQPEALREAKHSDGISLRTIHIWLIIGAVVISGMMFFATYHLSSRFRFLTDASEQQIELRKAARELMDASDYLTEKVQRFTIDGDRRFLDEYFSEAFEANHREEAIQRMTIGAASTQALQNLQNAMESSLELMKQEYYAMRLVIEAKGYTEYPEVLQSVKLSEADQALSAEDKMRRATRVVLNEDYYSLKEKIRDSMRASLNELEEMAYNTDASSLEAMGEELTLVRIVVVIQTLGILFMVWLTARLGIHPVLNAVERIKADSPIPEIGANEFRYLARTYNKMYEVYKNSLEHLNFKASHDELTGAYNRAGYDLLVSSMDLSSTYLILIDVDNFKTINDTYGHEIGDKVLVKVMNTLKNNFRSDDYICRMGGDEFVVLAVHATQMQHHLLETKINQINLELADTKDDLPATSISAGIVHGVPEKSVESLLHEADEALYETKHRGKHGYTFA